MKKSLFEKIYWILFLASIFYFAMFPMMLFIKYSAENKITNPIKLMSDACEQRDSCPQYKIFRNECAVAVDFDKCLRIKTDGGVNSLACNNDGTSHLIKETKPNAFLCFSIVPATKFIHRIIN